MFDSHLPLVEEPIARHTIFERESPRAGGTRRRREEPGRNLGVRVLVTKHLQQLRGRRRVCNEGRAAPRQKQSEARLVERIDQSRLRPFGSNLRMPLYVRHARTLPRRLRQRRHVDDTLPLLDCFTLLLP